MNPADLPSHSHNFWKADGVERPTWLSEDKEFLPSAKITHCARLLIRRIRQLPMDLVLFRGPQKRALKSAGAPKTGYRAPRTRLPRGLHVV
ncbi:hypothetical protein NPIL_530871 [Nephila pilipes]|uniref:Uncharacterized protein n=1 Tax=Nephila pilipes TaxID=299642 RepID=A0A8X6PSV1_NEPPI|nr:hypothetical protein NPIL_530871 [Nephila pilipes]